MNILEQRGRKLNRQLIKKGPVIYWLSRDQRVKDNWGLLAASELALETKEPLIVFFSLADNYLDASSRHYSFMLSGLIELEEKLAKFNIPFHILLGDPVESIVKFVRKYQPGVLISDFSPLRTNRQWKEAVAKESSVAFFEVDAHNIIPAWLASSKQEYGAYTIRPKLKRLLPSYLLPFPDLKKQVINIQPLVKNNQEKIYQFLKMNKSKEELMERYKFIPGEKAAIKAMKHFLEYRLASYHLHRNDPTIDGQSNLSPYLHFGQLSPQRLALEVDRSLAPKEAREDFLEELIIRRELADNFCLYNKDYDNFNGFPNWAQDTLKKHASTKREYLYEKKDFEFAKTHDKLWNAAQNEMLKTGKMHGYMRMYWAKKILEWTRNVESAIEIAIYLNDRYELCGRDPNGYTGIAWSMGGVHDRAWFERPVFGKVRYMNDQGCRRKFKVDGYIARWNE